MSELQVVKTYMTSEEAHIDRLTLESENIRCYIADEATIGLAWHLSSAIGGVKLMVASSDWERASEILDTQTMNREDVIGDAWKSGGSREGEDASSDDYETLNPREESANRALKAVWLGLLFFPLQFYAAYLLLFKVFASELPLNARSRRNAWIATAINIPCLIAGYAIWRFVYLS